MSNIKIPEPETIRVELLNGENLYYLHHSPMQMETYANERVREALEAAAKKPREYAMTLDQNGWGNRYPDELTAIFNAADNIADRIRALIPNRKG